VAEELHVERIEVGRHAVGRRDGAQAGDVVDKLDILRLADEIFAFEVFADIGPRASLGETLCQIQGKP
jgi:hypothetical protein